MLTRDALKPADDTQNCGWAQLGATAGRQCRGARGALRNPGYTLTVGRLIPTLPVPPRSAGAEFLEDRRGPHYD